MVAIVKFIISATLLTSASAAAIRRQDLTALTGTTAVTGTTTVAASVVATGTSGVEEVSDPVLAVRPVSYTSKSSSALPAEITGTGPLGKLIVGLPVLAYRH